MKLCEMHADISDLDGVKLSLIYWFFFSFLPGIAG